MGPTIDEGVTHSPARNPKRNEKLMTPHQLASQFCANAHDGCAGLGIDDKLRTIRMWPRREECTVAKERCPYFETHVAPHVRQLEAGPFRDSVKQAVELYVKRLPLAERRTARLNIYGQHPDEVADKLAGARTCPECGKPMEARRRLCEPCAKSKRRSAWQTANAKRGMTYNS